MKIVFIQKIVPAQPKRKILFIVNPNAGKRLGVPVTDQIHAGMVPGIEYHVEVWRDKDHFAEISAMLENDNFTDAVAVGGDGTVNEVARTILNTGITLGIVPIGSGNGLARSLGLSMRVPEVIQQLLNGRTLTIDSGTVNGIPFFCTSGIGFDAEVGTLFASSIKRGLSSYIKITLKELLRYRAKKYLLEFNGEKIEREAFLITVANAGQYGNDFYIAPQASLQDGLFHVIILKPFNVLTVAGLMTKIMLRKAHLSRYVETFTTSKIRVVRQSEGAIHFDGEPALAKTEIVFENKPASLKVIVGDNFKAA